MLPARRIAVFLLVLTAWPAAGEAQTVRGTLVEEGTGDPVAGAFIILEDSTGVETSTALTGPAGTWLLNAPRPGVYRLRADRIGYASTFSEPLDVGAGQSITFRMAVAVEPVGLSGLDVQTTDSRCEMLREESLAIDRVWEEARKALAAIVWTGQQPYYRFDAVHFQRTLDAEANPTSEVEYEEVRYFGRHPFRSIPARDLALGGFVQTVAGSQRFYGPDAEVMLSTDFRRRHCFRLAATEADGKLGLVFQPLDDVRLADISGTLWLDARNSELRSLDFRYENLNLRVETERLGGHVDFARLPSGAWIVRSWAIRAPVVEMGPPRRSSTGRLLPPNRVLTAIDEGGGQVTAVFLTSRLVGRTSTDTLPVRPPPDSLIVRFPLFE